jgi:hypothetical protein
VKEDSPEELYLMPWEGCMDVNIRIGRDFISAWNLKYDYIEKDEGEYRDLAAVVKKELTAGSSLSNETFIRILDWKSPRVKRIVNMKEFSLYQRGIACAFGAQEEQKMALLLCLPGIGTKGASVILHFMYPDSFPIVGFRTAETLRYAGHLQSRRIDFAHYPSFRAAILRIAKENPGFSLRTIDRALFTYHKLYLSHFLKHRMAAKENNFKQRNGQLPAFSA